MPTTFTSSLTLDHIAYDIWLTLRNGSISDDDDLDIRQIKYWVKNNRAVWLKNELHKGNAVSQKFIQEVNNGCVQLERVDQSTCPLVPADCTILRTSIDIPNTIEKFGIPTLTRVGPALIKEATYFIVPYERIPYVGNGRFNSKSIYAFWKDNRIYLVSKGESLNYIGMSKCNIRGVFADPEAVPGYVSTDDYPITEQLVVYMKDMILKADVSSFLNSIGDIINDAASPTITQ